MEERAKKLEATVGLSHATNSCSISSNDKNELTIKEEENRRKKAPHKMRVANSSTKRIIHLYYCDFHYADLYSGIFMGEDLTNKKK